MCFSKTVENLILVNYSDIIGEHILTSAAK